MQQRLKDLSPTIPHKMVNSGACSAKHTALICAPTEVRVGRFFAAKPAEKAIGKSFAISGHQ
jgi:hypothetical protein